MRVVALLILGCLALAGCADSPAAAPEPSGGFDGTLDENSGILQGVVLDEAIVPVQGATVTLLSDGQQMETDQNGVFLFGPIPSGAHFINVTSLIHTSVQLQAFVEPGVANPPMVKVQITRLFSEQPYLVAEQFQGHIECGYAHPAGSSLCLNDYTRFVPGNNGSAPQLQETGLDDRDHDYAIETGWQSHIVEMTWVPSADSTSQYMNAIVSHFPRPATHWYASQAGVDPIWLRMDEGVEHENRQSDPSLVPPEGLPNMHFFAAVARDSNAGPPGSLAAIGISQDFEVFFNTFYYGLAPEGWSFLNGDENPF